MTKFITVNIDKGGTGKSTLSYNLAKWLSMRKCKRVLLIDGDRSTNLSQSFKKESLMDTESTVIDIFNKKTVEFQNITENLDFLQGSVMLDDDKLDLKSRQNNCMIFYMWIADNYEMLEEYDYVIIDTHNDTSLVTANFLAVSDMVIGVSEPSRNGFRAWLELEDTLDYLKTELIDVRTRETYVTAEAYLIANNVDHRTNSSKQFLEMAELQENYLGMIQAKELMRKSLLEDTSIFEMYDLMSENDRKKHQKFYDNIENVFEKITKNIA